MNSGAAPLRLPAVLTHREAPAAMEALLGAFGQSAAGAEKGSWRIDASALSDFDSSALAVLLACKRQASAVHASLAIEGAPPKLVRLGQLYGLGGLLLADAAASEATAPLPSSAT